MPEGTIRTQPLPRLRGGADVDWDAHAERLNAAFAEIVFDGVNHFLPPGEKMTKVEDEVTVRRGPHFEPGDFAVPELEATVVMAKGPDNCLHDNRAQLALDLLRALNRWIHLNLNVDLSDLIEVKLMWVETTGIGARFSGSVEYGWGGGDAVVGQGSLPV